MLLSSPLFLEEKKKKKREQRREWVREGWDWSWKWLFKKNPNTGTGLAFLHSLQEKDKANHIFWYAHFYCKLFTYIKFSDIIKKCIEEKCQFQIYLNQHNKTGDQKTVRTELHMPRQSPFPCWKWGVNFWPRNISERPRIHPLSPISQSITEI